MAKAEQVDVLRQGTRAWNAWRHEHPTEPIDAADADLSGVSLAGADLSGADLCRASLAGSDLSSAFLMGANLHGADLSRATFVDAHLDGAVLSHAHLRAANLSGANLGRAVLRGAWLQGANFIRAVVAGADFTGAFLDSTAFNDVDLSESVGLSSVTHWRPSTVGIDTLFRSRGRIPEVFLRGVGVPEALITYLPSLLAQPLQFYSCFISYSHVDQSFARRLHDALQGRGIRCWLDEHQVLPGHDILDEVDRGIRLWDKVLLCASEASLSSWWVDGEITKAFQKEQALMKDRGVKVRALIPLNLDGYLFKWQSGKASEVKARLAADFTGWQHDNATFEAQFDRLVKALRTDEGREVPPESFL